MLPNELYCNKIGWYILFENDNNLNHYFRK